MLKKISLIRSRSSVIARDLPARRGLRLFENQPERDVMFARKTLAVVVLWRERYRIIPDARDLHPHAAPSRVYFLDFARELETGDRMISQPDSRSFSEEDRGDLLACRRLGEHGYCDRGPDAFLDRFRQGHVARAGLEQPAHHMVDVLG